MTLPPHSRAKVEERTLDVEARRRQREAGERLRAGAAKGLREVLRARHPDYSWDVFEANSSEGKP